jgi:hypothetical protein
MFFGSCMKTNAGISPINNELDMYYERNARLNGMTVQRYKIKMRENYIIRRYCLRKK